MIQTRYLTGPRGEVTAADIPSAHKNRRPALVAGTVMALALVVCGNLRAQGFSETLGGLDVNVSGFGTYGGVVTNTDDAQFVRNGQYSGATKSPNDKVDTNLGVQFTARANSWLSATVQVLDQEGLSESQMTASLEWGFLKIEPVNGLAVKLGRFLAPVFLISDTRNINYSNTWIRPPNEVYALAGLGDVDGGEATYRIPLGTSHLVVTGFTGNGKIEGEPSVNAYDIHGGEVRWDINWLTLRAGYDSEKHVIAIDGVYDRYTFSGLGAIVDRDNFIAQVEAVSRRSSNYATIVNANGWYALGGYRLGKFTPYVYRAQTTRVQPVNPYFGLSFDQKTTAIGLRWDAFSAADLKFQVERVDPQGTSGISFSDAGTYPGVSPSLGSKEVTALSIAIDFVF